VSTALIVGRLIIDWSWERVVLGAAKGDLADVDAVVDQLDDGHLRHLRPVGLRKVTFALEATIGFAGGLGVESPGPCGWEGVR
jgi:hypothetical protein